MDDNSEAILIRFRTAAAGFIEAVDSASNSERNEFVKAVHRAVAELISSALGLPAVEPDTTNVSDIPFDSETWAELLRTLKQKLGPLDTYWGTFDSTTKSEPFQASLAGDLSEIYFDLKNNLQLEKTGVSRGDLLWDLRESFQTHWGRHATDALKAMYDLHVD